MEILDLKLVRADPATQARERISWDTVQEYIEAIEANDKEWPFPPIIIFYDGETHWLGDGFHRVAAGRRVYLETVPADVHEGTRRDAILYAAGANADHGLRRTAADKRKAVLVLLNDEEWGQWSDREIARQCGVSHPFVGKVRKEVTGNDSGDNGERVYVNKHGQTAVMNTGSIGKSEPSYAPIWDLEIRVRTWLAGEDVKKMGHADPLDSLLVIKEKRVGWGVPWNNLKVMLDAGGVEYRDGDLRQACNNVLDQIRQERDKERPLVDQPVLDGELGADPYEPPAITPHGRLSRLREIQREIEKYVIKSEPPATFAYNRLVRAIDECVQEVRQLRGVSEHEK